MILVFSHLGEAKARHLVPNIERTRILFPEYEIALILSRETSIKEIPSYVRVHTYEPFPDVKEVLDRLEHDQKFRGGFWRFSLERIFALEQLHNLINGSPILHIESDVILLPNIPLNNIANTRNLAWNCYNENHDVSALLFSPSSTHTSQLVAALKDCIVEQPHLTDMTSLSLIRRERILEVDLFPSFHNEIQEIKNPRASIINFQNENLPLDGIFDGAAIGMWLFGHDPRNNYGKYSVHDDSPIRNGNSWIDAKGINYEITDEGNLFAVSYTNPLVKVPIWNLHVHSKNRKLLSEDWQSELIKFVNLSKNKSEIEVFEINALCLMFLDSIRTKTLLRFLAGLPLIHKLRRKLSDGRAVLKKWLSVIDGSFK